MSTSTSGRKIGRLTISSTRKSTMGELRDEQKWLAKQTKQFVKDESKSLAGVTEEMSTFPTKQQGNHFAPAFADPLLSAYDLLSTGKLVSKPRRSLFSILMLLR